MRRRRYLITVCVALAVALAGQSAASGSLDPASVAPALPATGTGIPGPGKFLVAKRSLDDPHFAQSVVYLVEHNEGGTMGLIVNRRGDFSLSEALPEIEDAQAKKHALYYGGPVALSVILMLLRGESALEGMAQVVDDIYISSERRVLDEIIAAKKPASEVRFYIGHAGWAAGQLDFELERGGWHVVKADTEAIFSSDAGSLWQRLIEQLEPAGIQAKNRSSAADLKLTVKPPLIHKQKLGFTYVVRSASPLPLLFWLSPGFEFLVDQHVLLFGFSGNFSLR